MLMLFIMRWWIVDAVPEITNFRPKFFAFIMLSYLTFETAIVKTKLLLHFFLIHKAIFTRYSNAQSWNVFWKVGKHGILSHPHPQEDGMLKILHTFLGEGRTTRFSLLGEWGESLTHWWKILLIPPPPRKVLPSIPPPPPPPSKKKKNSLH